MPVRYSSRLVAFTPNSLRHKIVWSTAPVPALLVDGWTSVLAMFLNYTPVCAGGYFMRPLRVSKRGAAVNIEVSCLVNGHFSREVGLEG